MNGWSRTDEGASAARLTESLSPADATRLSLLQGLLPLAVAGIIEQVRQEDWPTRQERLERIKKRWADEGKLSFSEALLVRTRRGETVAEFRDLAEVLAVMAFVPGGVRAFGLHWEETDDDSNR